MRGREREREGERERESVCERERDGERKKIIERLRKRNRLKERRKSGTIPFCTTRCYDTQYIQIPLPAAFSTSTKNIAMLLTQRCSTYVCDARATTEID